MELGIDTSRWDPEVNWKQYTWQYAFIKVSEGILEDLMFKLQWRAAEGQVYRGGYHFFRPFVNWRNSADAFMRYLEREGLGELPPVLDLEVTDHIGYAVICESALEWLRSVHRRSGKRPIVYTSPNFANNVAKLYLYPEFGDYLLWQAMYPWDTIDEDWTLEQRIERIRAVITGEYNYKPFVSSRPWKEQGRKLAFAQWTGKGLPEHIPGYPLGHKEAVDINFYNGTLQDMKYQFNLSDLPMKGVIDVSSKPITWTATLLVGQQSRLRMAPGLQAQVIEVMTGPLSLQGCGTKVQKDNYYWAEVVLPKPGWIAFTTSYTDVKWLVAAQRKLVRSVIYYDDGTQDEMVPKP